MTVSTRVAIRGLLFASVFALGAYGVATASNPDDVAKAKATQSCAQCDLSGADLSGLNAAKGDFHGADLTGTKLYKADLRAADLTDARLDGTDLTGANLSAAKGAVLTSTTKTDDRTTCVDGSAGPCK
jgi:uncharacterized protein YjbI with pentapeptide repeats